jgi:hypothetical protein
MKYSAGQNQGGGGGTSAPAVDGTGNGLIKKGSIEVFGCDGLRLFCLILIKDLTHMVDGHSAEYHRCKQR